MLGYDPKSRIIGYFTVKISTWVGLREAKFEDKMLLLLKEMSVIV